MASIDFEVEDYLDEATTEALERELARRAKRDAKKKAPHIEAWTPAGLAADLRHVFYARDPSRFEALLVVLEKHEAVPA